jgi:hypothetical protein
VAPSRAVVVQTSSDRPDARIRRGPLSGDGALRVARGPYGAGTVIAPQPISKQKEANAADPEKHPVVNRNVRRHVADVMDLKEVVVNHSFNEVEGAPS